MNGDDAVLDAWPRQRVLLVALAIFSLACAVRVALLHTARFGGDEALFFRIGMDIVEGKALPLLGTQVTDGAAKLPGPAFLYLMALPLTAWRAPEAQYLFIEVLGAVAVLVWWSTARSLFGERAGVVVGLCGACSPWAILYADRTWNPNVLPLFVGVALWCAWRLVREPGTRGAAVLLWPTLALLPQLHLSTPVALGGVGVVLALGLRGGRWRGFDRRAHLIGLGLAALLYVPLAVHEAQTGVANTRLVLKEVLGVGAVAGEGAPRHPWGFLWVPVYTVRLLSLDVTYHELSGYWGGPNEIACLQALIDGSAARPAHPLRAIALAASVVGSVGAWIVAWRARAHVASRRAVVSAGVIVVANTALMGVAAKQVFGHYVIAQLPFLLLVLGAAARALIEARRRAVVVALCLISGVGGVEAASSVSRNVDAKIGLGVHRAVAAVIAADAEAAGLAPSEPVALGFVGVRDSLYAWRIFVERALRAPWPIDPRATRRRYSIALRQAPRPRAASGDPVDLEYAVLWRLR